MSKIKVGQKYKVDRKAAKLHGWFVPSLSLDVITLKKKWTVSTGIRWNVEEDSFVLFEQMINDGSFTLIEEVTAVSSKLKSGDAVINIKNGKYATVRWVYSGGDYAWILYHRGSRQVQVKTDHLVPVPTFNRPLRETVRALLKECRCEVILPSGKGEIHLVMRPDDRDEGGGLILSRFYVDSGSLEITAAIYEKEQSHYAPEYAMALWAFTQWLEFRGHIVKPKEK